MSDSNPFDQPPIPPVGDSGPPLAPPSSPIGPRRGGFWKPAALGFGAAAMLGAGAFGLTQIGDDDDGSVATADVAAAVTEAPAVTGAGEPSEAGTSDAEAETESPAGTDAEVADVSLPEDVAEQIDASIAELGALGECLGFDELFGQIEDQLEDLQDLETGSLPEMPELEQLDELGDIETPAGAVTITVTGPDGVEIYTIAEGDGSVTVTKAGDEVSVATDGAATETASLDFGELTGQLDEVLGSLPEGTVPPGSLPFELGDIEACLESQE